MDTQVTKCEITATTFHFRILREFTRNNFDARTNRRTIAFRADCLHLYPIVAVSTLIPQEIGGLVPVRDKDIDVTVVIIVAKSSGTACLNQREAFPHLRRDIRKPPIAQVPKE